jgi:hypothetical protein
MLHATSGVFVRGILVRLRDPRLILFLTSDHRVRSEACVFLSCTYGMVPWSIDPDAWRLA